MVTSNKRENRAKLPGLPPVVEAKANVSQKRKVSHRCDHIVIVTL